MKKVGQREFKILIGDTVVQDKVDIFREMGYKSGFNTYSQFEYKNGKVYFESREVPGAIKVDSHQPRMVIYKYD